MTKYTLNEKYFEKIDTPNKAYFLGLLYADGCVSKGATASKFRITINLVEKDSRTLEVLKDDIAYTGPLQLWKKQPPRQNQKVLCFYSNKVAEDLLSLGCKERKTLELDYPTKLEDIYFLPFLRGFFDGDGCIAKVGKKNVVWMLIGLESILVGIKEKLESIYGLHPYIIKPKIGKYKDENIVYLKITRKKEIFQLMSLWYLETNLYLDRKYNKYRQFFLEERLQNYEEYGWNGYTGKNVSGKRRIVYINKKNEKEIFNSMSHAGEVLGYTKVGIAYRCNKYNRTKIFDQNKIKVCYEEDYKETEL